MKQFLKVMKCVVIDEAGAAVVSEIMIPWKGVMKLILAGDFRQMPPAKYTRADEYISCRPVILLSMVSFLSLSISLPPFISTPLLS